jgi:hypothetical protein
MPPSSFLPGRVPLSVLTTPYLACFYVFYVFFRGYAGLLQPAPGITK